MLTAAHHANGGGGGQAAHGRVRVRVRQREGGRKEGTEALRAVAPHTTSHQAWAGCRHAGRERVWRGGCFMPCVCHATPRGPVVSCHGCAGEKGGTNLMTRALALVGKRIETVPDPSQVGW